MPKTKKPKKGDGAEARKIWAAMSINRRRIYHSTVSETRQAAKEKYLERFNLYSEELDEALDGYSKTWTVRKVIIQLAD